MYNYPMAEKILEAGREKSTQPATTRINYLCTSSRQQCQCLPSFLLMKPRMDSSHQTSTTTSSLKQDLGKVNFSNVFQANSTTVLLPPTNNNTVAKAAAVATYCSTSNKSSPKPVSFVPRNQEIPPDEQSETVGHNSHGSHAQYHEQTSKSAGQKADINNYYDEPLLESESSYLCSLGASNNTNLCSRKHDDTDDSTYSSDNYEGIVKDKLAREGTGVKRRRNTEIHNLNERKRRDKINKKMRTLKELIPNCNKMDKASMLDDAIEYLKTLKFQLQIMSMGLCMPLMMSPQLMGAGILGLRPGTGGGIPCSLPQYPIAPLPVINGNGGVPMFGFPNQVPPMPISRAPFDHSYGWKSFYTTTFGN